MNLKYYLKGKKKVYTLKDKVNDEETKPAHYKFIKIKSINSNSPAEFLS